MAKRAILLFIITTCLTTILYAAQQPVPPKTLLIDLDVDSDNSDYNDYVPDRSPAEEAIEDKAGSLGKVIATGYNIWGKSGIPLFAQGFNLDAIAGNADDNPPRKPDVPVILELSASVDLSTAKITIGYDASDPARVMRVEGRLHPPKEGHLRLWMKDCTETRKKAGIASGGDYIPPGTHTPAQLGVTDQKRTVTLYAEGVTGSNSVGDQRITARVTDGHGTSAEDAVRLTVVSDIHGVKFYPTAKFTIPGDLTLDYGWDSFPAGSNPEGGFIGDPMEVKSKTGKCPPGSVLTMPFRGEDVSQYGIDNLRIFHYAKGKWVALPTVIDSLNGLLTSLISEPGVYAVSAREVKDTQPPMVKWLLPTKGQVITGESKLVSDARDDVGIFMIRFHLNGPLPVPDDLACPDLEIASDDTGMDGGWGATVDFSHFVSGKYVLSADATDLHNNTGSSTQEIVVQTNAVPPKVAIASAKYDPKTRTIKASGTVSDLGMGQFEPIMWSVVDGELGPLLRVDGNRWTAEQSSHARPKSKSRLTIAARDSFGNRASATAEVTIP